jgi:hypothetical protein
MLQIDDFPIMERIINQDTDHRHYGEAYDEHEYDLLKRVHRTFDPPVKRRRINCDGKHCKVCIPKETL